MNLAKRVGKKAASQVLVTQQKSVVAFWEFLWIRKERKVGKEKSFGVEKKK